MTITVLLRNNKSLYGLYDFTSNQATLPFVYKPKRPESLDPLIAFDLALECLWSVLHYKMSTIFPDMVYDHYAKFFPLCFRMKRDRSLKENLADAYMLQSLLFSESSVQMQLWKVIKCSKKSLNLITIDQLMTGFIPFLLVFFNDSNQILPLNSNEDIDPNAIFAYYCNNVKTRDYIKKLRDSVQLNLQLVRNYKILIPDTIVKDYVWTPFFQTVYMKSYEDSLANKANEADKFVSQSDYEKYTENALLLFYQDDAQVLPTKQYKYQPNVTYFSIPPEMLVFLNVYRDSFEVGCSDVNNIGNCYDRGAELELTSMNKEDMLTGTNTSWKKHDCSRFPFLLYFVLNLYTPFRETIISHYNDIQQTKDCNISVNLVTVSSRYNRKIASFNHPKAIDCIILFVLERGIRLNSTRNDTVEYDKKTTPKIVSIVVKPYTCVYITKAELMSNALSCCGLNDLPSTILMVRYSSE